MKGITKSLVYFKIAALLLTAGLPWAKASAVTVPFKGSLEGFETPSVPPSQPAVISAAGQASHLGRFIFSLVADVSADLSVATGTVQFTAANGDKIFGTFVGEATAIVLPLIWIEENITITGGTGHFEHVSGSVTLTRFVDVTNGHTAGSFAGVLLK